MANTQDAQTAVPVKLCSSHGSTHRSKSELLLKGKGPAPAAAFSHPALVRLLFTEVEQPQWFGTIQWLPFIRSYITAVKEAKHFRLKLLCSLYGTRPKDLPIPPARPRLLVFHERAFVDANPYSPHPNYAWTYHTHFHLGPCPAQYNTLTRLDALIRTKVAAGFRRFSNPEQAADELLDRQVEPENPLPSDQRPVPREAPHPFSCKGL